MNRPLSSSISSGPSGCTDLLSNRSEVLKPQQSGKLSFGGVGSRDVYNVSAPFVLNGERVIAGRVEPRDTEHAEIVFFREAGEDHWISIPGACRFPALQDPCITFVDSELLIGGVEYPVKLPDGRDCCQMQFFRGRRLDRMELVFKGPLRMKDIRMVEMLDGRIAFLSRPQGGRAGRGKIGFGVVRSLEGITAEVIEGAPLLADQCPVDEWVGGNEMHVLGDGRIGVLGHVAHFDSEGKRNYYAMAFILDPASSEATPLRIIASRSDFPDGPAKRPDLANVIFSGGLLRKGDGMATLYVGLSDVEAGWVRIPDPFV
jgi:hypothetical protein